MKDIIMTILITTYSVCLPILLRWLHQLKKDKKSNHDYITNSMSKMDNKLDNVVDCIAKLNDKIDFNEAMTSRYRIIRGADELRNGVKLSEENIEQLGEDIEIYKSYCEQHPNYKNHKGQRSMQLILGYENKEDEVL